MVIPEGGFPRAKPEDRHDPTRLDPIHNPPLKRLSDVIMEKPCVTTSEVRTSEDLTPRNTFGFEIALAELRNGNAVTRLGWNGNRLATFKGKIMKLRMVFQWTAEVELPEEFLGWHPFIVLLTTDGVLVPWLASQTDLLATDWVLAG